MDHPGNPSNLLSLSLLLSISILVGKAFTCAPEQPMLTLGNNETSVTFSFISPTPCANPNVTLKNFDKQTVVQVPLRDEDMYASDPALVNYTRHSYFFTAPIIQGDQYAWSFYSNQTITSGLGPFDFKIRNISQSNNTAKYLVIADMDLGNYSTDTRQALHSMNWKHLDGFIHMGDLAYDINTNNGLQGDQYFNAFWDILPTNPYLVIAGNHENYHKGALFNYRFRFPNRGLYYENNFWYVIR